MHFLKNSLQKQRVDTNKMEDDDDDDDAKEAAAAHQRRRINSSNNRREIRVALAKAYLECKMEKDLETVVASLVVRKGGGGGGELENDISNLWRNARVAVDDEDDEEGEEGEEENDDDALQTALGEVLMEKLLPKGGDNNNNNNKRRKVVEEGHFERLLHLQRFCEEYEENALKLKRDVLREEVSVLKWREERAKEKKKHMEKRRRVEESTGLPYVPELRKPTKAEVERFVREVEGGLEKKEYAPQFKEILDRVRKVMEGKKKKRDDGDGGGGRALVESAAAEYAMLHLGGAKYRAKKFELPRVEEEGDGDKIEEEEEDNDDKGHENDDKKEEEEDLEAKRREEQCEREFQLELEKSREANGISGGKKVVGANANVITHERWEGRMNSTKNASAAINGKHGADVEYLTYRDVIPNMNKVDDVDWEKCGRLGERVVFNVLIQKYRGTNVSVKWVNENEESNAFYDIMLIDPDSQSKTFIEVKATRFRDKNAFEISPWEWDFAVKPEVADRYQIWRVFGIGDGGDVNIVVINNPARLLREKKIGQALII